MLMFSYLRTNPFSPVELYKARWKAPSSERSPCDKVYEILVNLTIFNIDFSALYFRSTKYTD